MPDRHPEELGRLVLEALRRARVRGVVSAGWAGLGPREVRDEVLVVEDIPHDWLFARMAAVVHHGGAGTTHAGLRAGLPSVIVPFFLDQPFWGRRVAHLGLGPAPIPRRHLSADLLAGAITAAVTDGGMSRQAAEAGAIIRAEAGVKAAVDVFQRQFASIGGRS